MVSPCGVYSSCEQSSPPVPVREGAQCICRWLSNGEVASSRAARGQSYRQIGEDPSGEEGIYRNEDENTAAE